MIIDYDHNPNTTTDHKLQSLKESVQMALDGEIADLWERVKAHVIKMLPKHQSDLTPQYAECSTAANVAEKVVTIPGITALTEGLAIAVKFAGSNTAASPTLNVNGLGAKDIMRYGTTRPSTSAASSWNAGSVVKFVYDGTYWQMVGWINTTYSGMTDAEYQAGTSTTNRLITPARLKAAIEYHTSDMREDVDELTDAQSASVAATLSGVDGTIYLRKVGKTVMMFLTLGDGTILSNATGTDVIATLPEGWRPKKYFVTTGMARDAGLWASASYSPFTLAVDTTGTVTLRYTASVIKTQMYLVAQACYIAN